jgi:mannose-1-phosphate guanylyltransferase/mannose-6-phosphate isomerase
VVGNEEHRFLVLDQLRELGVEPSAVLLEPMGRNTAPAVTLAALQALEGGSDPVLVVTPADQTVTDPAAFTAALRRAVPWPPLAPSPSWASRPTGPRPATATSAPAAAAWRSSSRSPTWPPPSATWPGGYFWNAGMFVLRRRCGWRRWSASAPTSPPPAARPGRRADRRALRAPGQGRVRRRAVESVDYAVMERCPGSGIDIRMEPLDAGWNDLGAWEAVWQVAPKDAQGNASVGDAIVSDSRNTLVHATSRLVSAVGLDDVVVVETPDAVLVADRERSQDVKKIVAQLGREQRGEHTLHRKVHRPWGWYDSIDHGPRHQVKRIMVKPGAA